MNKLLIIYCVAYAVLLCSTLYFVPAKYALKTVVVAASFFLASSIFFSMESYKGWPVGGVEKERARLLSVIIEEPDDKQEGAIYIWIVRNHKWMLTGMELLDPRVALRYSGENQPRAHKLPYTQEDASGFRKAQKAIEEGMYVEIFGDKEGEGGNGEQTGTAGGSPEYEGIEDTPYALTIEDPRRLMPKSLNP